MYFPCLAALISLLGVFATARDQIPLAPEPVEEIPHLGFGTWNTHRSTAQDVVATAIETGFRHIDCAAIYGNEVEVGRGITDGLERAKVSRGDIWVTSKLWNTAHSAEAVPKALDKTLEDLGLEYLDLYLMHWPVADEEGEKKIEFLDTWRAMTKLLSTSKVRHIGVSNFSPRQMQALLDATPATPPYAHQMELHPYLQQSEFIDWHADHNIHTTAYSPLGNTNPTYGSSRKEHAAAAVPPLLENELMRRIADARGCTPAQVALAWGMGRGTSVIPKSEDPAHIREDFGATDCELAADDYSRLETQMPVKRFNNPSKSWSVTLYEGLEDAPALLGLDRAWQGKDQGIEGIVGAVRGWCLSMLSSVTAWNREL